MVLVIRKVLSMGLEYCAADGTVGRMKIFTSPRGRCGIFLVKERWQSGRLRRS